MSGCHSLRFTEEMKGTFAFGIKDFQDSPVQGQHNEIRLMFHLTISTEDVRRFIDDKDHVAEAQGWVECDALGGRLPVTKGVFNLFVAEGPRSRRMLYRLEFQDGVERPLTLTGFKEINGGLPTDVWPETSTLYTRVFEGHVQPEDDETAPLVGSGILHILPADFARQLTTFRVEGGTLGGRIRALLDFGRLFAGQLVIVFWPPRRPGRRP